MMVRRSGFPILGSCSVQGSNSGFGSGFRSPFAFGAQNKTRNRTVKTNPELNTNREPRTLNREQGVTP